MIDIVIPSKQELFLKNTIEDVLKNAEGDITVYPILDGYEIPDEEIVKDPRVNYIRFPPTQYAKKRHGINHVAEIGSGKYIMSLDAHCMVAPGFDVKLTADLDENWVAIPRRHRLDAKNWCLQRQADGRPPIDYEYTMWPDSSRGPIGLHGFKWDDRTLSRSDLLIDDQMHFQGSCWIMHKSWFKRCEFMHIEGYTGWGQEAEEIGLTTWLTGGRVITNKKTWYAHLHKGREYGRMYYLDKRDTRLSDAYSWDFWFNNRPLKNRVHDFDWFIEKFWPIPNWKENWKEILGYGKES